MNKPNFFIIGAPRCGTTALSVYLKEHPNVFFSDLKEPGYFAMDMGPRFIKNLNDYLALFKKADPSRHQAIGEGSVVYLLSKVAVNNIVEFQPGAKFIVMLRNPIELVRSYHSKMLYSALESEMDLGEALRMDKIRTGTGDYASPWDMNSHLYIERGMLGEQMQRLYQNVSRDRVKVIVYDDLVANPLSVYKDVLEFLGLPYDGRTNFPTVNKSRIPYSRRLQAVMSWLMRVSWPVRRLFGLYGTGVPTRVADMTTKEGMMNQLSGETQNQLRKIYTEDVKLLSNILGRDFSGWLENK